MNLPDKEKLTAQEEVWAIEWFKDCQWREMEESDFDDLSSEEIHKGIEKHFCGGINAFKQASQPV